MSRRSHPVLELTLVRLREYLREPEAIFWTLVFPLLMSLALGVAFRAREPLPVKIGVTSGPGDAQVAAALRADPGLVPQPLAPDAAPVALAAGRVALVVVPGAPPTYWYDPTREESRGARMAVDAALQRAAGRQDPLAPATREVTEKGSRYIDFLIPGLLGMNLMGTGMWGVGFSIVFARSRGMLKRLVASPMSRRDYLLGQMLGRLVLLPPEVVILLAFGHLAFGVPLRGSLLLLGGICLLGAVAFTGLGLLVASRARTIEAVSGLMNFVMMPMWLLSGIFFSPSRFPDPVQPFVHVLPLTALNDALRAVMLEGAGLTAVAGELALLAGWAAASFAAALALFRWR